MRLGCSFVLKDSWFRSCEFAFKSVIRDNGLVRRRVEPATTLNGIIVVLRNVGFYVNQRRAVQNVHFAEPETAALNAEQSHTRHSPGIGPSRNSCCKQSTFHSVTVRHHAHTRSRRSIKPIDQPDTVKTGEVFQSIDELGAQFNRAWRGPGTARLNGRAGGLLVLGMNMADCREAKFAWRVVLW